MRNINYIAMPLFITDSIVVIILVDTHIQIGLVARLLPCFSVVAISGAEH